MMRCRGRVASLVHHTDPICICLRKLAEERRSLVLCRIALSSCSPFLPWPPPPDGDSVKMNSLTLPDCLEWWNQITTVPTQPTFPVRMGCQIIPAIIELSVFPFDQQIGTYSFSALRHSLITGCRLLTSCPCAPFLMRLKPVQRNPQSALKLIESIVLTVQDFSQSRFLIDHHPRILLVFHFPYALNEDPNSADHTNTHQKQFYCDPFRHGRPLFLFVRDAISLPYCCDRRRMLTITIIVHNNSLRLSQIIRTRRDANDLTALSRIVFSFEPDARLPICT